MNVAASEDLQLMDLLVVEDHQLDGRLAALRMVELQFKPVPDSIVVDELAIEQPDL
ncbi:MAG: hypothetical protein WBD67_00445 [Terracidiphilus sp.]